MGAAHPAPMVTPYCAAKAAVVSLTQALALEWASANVRVNAVAPGPVWTPLIPSTMPEEKVKEFGKSTAFERPAQPAELAAMYVFLASEESRYITGGVFDLTGGQMLP